MSKKAFFKKFTESAPAQWTRRDDTGIKLFWKVDHCPTVKDTDTFDVSGEVDRFIKYITKVQSDIRQKEFERNLGILFGHYFNCRLCMKGSSRENQDKIRPIMLSLYDLTTLLVLDAESIGVKCSTQFIDDWRRRTEKPFLFEYLFTNNKPGQTHQKNNRFPNIYDRDLLSSYFDKLKAARYLHPDNKTEDWLYWFGHGDDETGREVLRWAGLLKELAYMINTLFDKGNDNWQITKKIFTIDGKEPNTNSLKNAASRYERSEDDPPKVLAEILRV